MKQKMVTWVGLIVCSRGSELRQSALAWRGLMRLSPNVRRDSIRIRISSRHIAPMTRYQLKKARQNTFTPKMRITPPNIIRYRVSMSSALVLNVDWDGNTTFHGWKVSRRAVAMSQSIFLKRLFSATNGRKVGDE